MSGNGDSASQDYRQFTILLGSPSDQPRLGFDVCADAFAEIVERSRPQFAIAIFGDWGRARRR